LLLFSLHKFTDVCELFAWLSPLVGEITERCFIFPGWSSMGYICVVLKYAFCECLRVALCSVIFLDDLSSHKRLQKVSGEQSSHLDTYMKHRPFESCECQTTPTWNDGSW